MLEFEFAALFTLAAVLASGSLVASLRGALPMVRQLKAGLAACPEKLELRCTITETVVRWNDGTVVALPLRSRAPARPAMRAAA
jgi:hypothetical protein